MWQGKPVSEWTPLEGVRFFELLMNDKYVLSTALYEEFFTVKSFMEKELPVVWEEYLEWCRLTCTFPAYKVVSQHTIIFNKQLDLTNLITYLLENTEGWGWVMCPDYNPPRDSDWWFGCWNSSNKQKACDCDNGKVKHQALLFAESLKEE